MREVGKPMRDTTTTWIQDRDTGSLLCVIETSSAEPSPLTPGEALAKLFLDNAERGAHAANDVLVDELLKRRRAIQALADPSGP